MDTKAEQTLQTVKVYWISLGPDAISPETSDSLLLFIFSKTETVLGDVLEDASCELSLKFSNRGLKEVESTKYL